MPPRSLKYGTGRTQLPVASGSYSPTSTQSASSLSRSPVGSPSAYARQQHAQQQMFPRQNSGASIVSNNTCASLPRASPTARRPSTASLPRPSSGVVPSCPTPPLSAPVRQGYLEKKRFPQTSKRFYYVLHERELRRYEDDTKQSLRKTYQITRGSECRIEKNMLVLDLASPGGGKKKSCTLAGTSVRELEDWGRAFSDCIRRLRFERGQSSSKLSRSQSIRRCPGFDTLFETYKTHLTQEIDVSDAANPETILRVVRDLANPTSLALSKLKDSRVNFELEGTLASIWAHFDVDKDGYLNPDENRALVSEYFRAVERHTPSLIQDIIERVITLFIKDPRDVPQGFVKNIREQAEQRLKAFFQNLQARHEDIARELWQKMDTNEDGAVERGEFMQVFLDCCEIADLSSAVRTSVGDDVAAAVTGLLRKHLTRDPGTCGLKNIGNTCYMNTAIQCLSATVKFRQFFLSGKYKQYINAKNRLGTKGKLANAFADMLACMWKGADQVHTPNNFKKHLGCVNEQFSGYGQEDCHELISVLLDNLHEDLNYVTEKRYVELKDPPRATDETLSAMWWNHHITQNMGVVVSLFHGQIKSVVTCAKCSHVSKAFDPFMYLSVPVPASGKPNLAQCLSGYLGTEDVKKESDWYCSKCKKHQPFRKAVSLWRLPQYLVVHLKRFKYSAYGTITSKIATEVTFPEVFSPEPWCARPLDETLESSAGEMYPGRTDVTTPAMPFLSPRATTLTSPLTSPVHSFARPGHGSGSSVLSPQTYTSPTTFSPVERSGVEPGNYQLYAVANHYGTSSGGHYTAFAKVADHWQTFDDSYVSPLKVWSREDKFFLKVLYSFGSRVCTPLTPPPPPSWLT